MIKTKMRTITSEDRRYKIAGIWSNFRGLKKTRFTSKSKHFQDKAGTNKYDKQGIADANGELNMSSLVQELGPIITTQPPTHLFDPHLVAIS